MKLRHLIAGAIAIALTAGSAAAKEWKQVRIGTEGAYPPFNFIDTNNELQGFDIDIAKALCEKMGVECTFVAQDWDGIIPALLANKYDAIIASMSITEERKEKVAFTDKYYSSPMAFAARKGSGITDTSPKALAGKTIGAQGSTIMATYLEELYGESEIKLYGTQDEANLDLANGRLDAVLYDKLVGYEFVQSDAGACCEFAGGDITDPKHVGDGIGIAVRKGDDDLREMFNKAIAAIREDSTYDKINEKYFPFSIY